MAKDGPQYPDHYLDRLEILWGEGFLSPGGAEEVGLIVGERDLAGKTVLDIGCGVGGPALCLVRDFGAARIIAIDVEKRIVERARRTIAEAGLADRIDIRLVVPGRLPLEDASVDAVFSKDAMVHIPDKPAIYAEVLRVLKPGGWFMASDWLAGENIGTSQGWTRYQAAGQLDFTMITADATETAIREAGFVDVSSTDRNGWFAPMARQEADAVKGPLKDDLIAAIGAERHAAWIEVREGLADAVADGALRPTHLHGRKPG
ncbi:MAG: methyltransferase domain-containing protein [Pseudomonadota bacterium]